MSARIIVDKTLLRQRLQRSVSRPVPGSDFLMGHAVNEVLDRLAAVDRVFDTCLALNGVTSDLAKGVEASGKVHRVIRMEPVSGACRLEDPWPCFVADEEALPVAEASLDLIVAPLWLHWSNDLPGTLLQLRRALKPDGLLLASLLGDISLHELRFASAAAEELVSKGGSPRVLPFADIRDLGALLQRAGFALPVVDRDSLIVRFGSPFALMNDLKAMGASNCLVERSRTPATRAFLAAMAETYQERFSDPDGRQRATFDLISMSGWCPHESQQKPAQRGSADISLTDVLGRDRR